MEIRLSNIFYLIFVRRRKPFSKVLGAGQLMTTQPIERCAAKFGVLYAQTLIVDLVRKLERYEDD